MNDQHLSDEAVAAHADGVLTGHARDRAARHTARCAECAHAVRVQREAAWQLRAAVAPALPIGLLDRLRHVPDTTELRGPPSTFGPDGAPVLPTTAWPGSGHGLLGQPMAGLVPTRPETAHSRLRPLLATTVATLAVAGAVTAGTMGVAGGASVQRRPADEHIVPIHSTHGPVGNLPPLTAFRAAGHPSR